MKILLSDGRVLVGVFLCTDKALLRAGTARYLFFVICLIPKLLGFVFLMSNEAVFLAFFYPQYVKLNTL